MPQQQKVVPSTKLAARALARESRQKPWALSQSTDPRIRNRPALQPPASQPSKSKLSGSKSSASKPPTSKPVSKAVTSKLPDSKPLPSKSSALQAAVSKHSASEASSSKTSKAKPPVLKPPEVKSAKSNPSTSKASTSKPSAKKAPLPTSSNSTFSMIPSAISNPKPLTSCIRNRPALPPLVLAIPAPDAFTKASSTSSASASEASTPISTPPSSPEATAPSSPNKQVNFAEHVTIHKIPARNKSKIETFPKTQKTDPRGRPRIKRPSSQPLNAQKVQVSRTRSPPPRPVSRLSHNRSDLDDEDSPNTIPQTRSNSISDLDPFWQETEQSMSLTAINHMTLSSKTLICPEAAPKPLTTSTESVFAASGQSHQDFLAKYKEKDPSPPIVAPVDREDFLAKYKEKDSSQPAVPLVIDREAFLAKKSEKKSSVPAVPVVEHEVFLASYSDEVPSRSMVTITADQEEFLAKYQDEDSLSSIGSIDGDPEAHLAKFKEKEEPSPQNAPVVLEREAVPPKNPEGEPSPQTAPVVLDREAVLPKDTEEGEPSPQSAPVVLDREAMLAKYKEEDEEPSRRIIPVVVLDSADNSKSPEEWAAEAKAFAKRVSDALRREREERIGAMSEEETEEPSRLDEDDYDD